MVDVPGERGAAAGEGGLAAQYVNMLSSLHAAMVNFHLYPPTSDIVEGSVTRALEELQQALQARESITLCELEGKLLINDFCLEERDQARPNTIAFLKDLALWEARSISFEPGLRDEELRRFLEIFSRKRADRTLEGSLNGFLAAENISHIKVDEKIYVSLGKDQEVTAAASDGPASDAMSMLKDEVFVRYLIGNVSSLEASPEEVAALMSDPGRIEAAFKSALTGFEGFGQAMTPEKARLVRDTVNRMYGLVEKLEDEETKETLGREMVGILSALETETLLEVLTESSPQAVREGGMRGEIISSMEGEQVLKLTDQVIGRYRAAIAAREGMGPQEYDDAVSALNELLAELYREGDPSRHVEITRRLRESGLMAELAQSHPRAGREMKIYAAVSEIRSSRSLRALEGLSDGEVRDLAGKMLDLGEKEVAGKIIAVTLRNLESGRPDFRLRACLFLKDIYRDFRERGYRAEIAEKSDGLIDILAREQDPEVKEGLLNLLGCLANDLFVEGGLDLFERVTSVMVSAAEGEDARMKEAARTALASLNPWDVGRPLADSLYSDDERMRGLAARLLPYIERSMTAKEIVDRLKGEEEVSVTPQLADACRVMGEPVFSALNQVLEGNVREEVYIRTLQLLELIGGAPALSAVKTAEDNPIPSVRAQAVRCMARLAPGDPTLLTHFMRALEDDEADVRREGARGLGTIDDPRSVDVLVGIIQGRSLTGKDENPRVEEAACMALARLGPERALAPLCDLLRKKSFALRRRTVQPRVKAAACYALGQIGGPEVVELVRGYLDDADPILRNEARKALGALRKRGCAD